MNVANTTVHVDRKSSTVLVLFGAVNKRRTHHRHDANIKVKTNTKTLVRDNTRRDGDSKSHKEKERKKNEHTRLNLDGLFSPQPGRTIKICIPSTLPTSI